MKKDIITIFHPSIKDNVLWHKYKRDIEVIISTWLDGCDKDQQRLPIVHLLKI